MTKYVVFDEGTEIHGTHLLGLIAPITISDTQHPLAKHNLEDIKLDGWYPLQNVLDFISDVEQLPSAISDLVALGVKLGREVELPEGLTFEQWLYAQNDIVQQGYRNGDPGSFEAEQIDEKTYRFSVRSPIPSDVMYGIYYGVMPRLLGEQKFTLEREIKSVSESIYTLRLTDK
ncbi:MAG: hypothetical protein ACFB51_19745 [Anaerolineae bacterium]